MSSPAILRKVYAPRNKTTGARRLPKARDGGAEILAAEPLPLSRARDRVERPVDQKYAGRKFEFALASRGPIGA